MAVGPKNSPEILIFVGDSASPVPPALRRSHHRGDWRHWRKALNNPQRANRALLRLKTEALLDRRRARPESRQILGVRGADPEKLQPL